MSFWKSLFGAGQPAAAKSAQQAAYNGFDISAEPYATEGKFQVAGTITKEIGGTLKTHRFIRADTFATRDEAATFTIIKARQIIDQQGDRIFS